MANWVEKYQPYKTVAGCQLRTGTVLRRVPFSTTFLADNQFAVDVKGKLHSQSLDKLHPAVAAARADNVELLETCERVRFDPDQGSAELQKLIEIGTELASKLSRKRSKAAS